jgi:Zn-dependent protease with chaperone function
MSLLATIAVVLLSLLLLHAALAPGLHLLARWLYRGALPARTDRSRTRAAFLLLSGSPVIVAVVGLSALGHLAEGGGAWAGLLAACRQLHEHCDLLLGNSTAELGVYGGLLLLVGGWLARAGWQAVAPTLAVSRLPRVESNPVHAARLQAAAAAAATEVPVEVVGGVAGLAVTAGFLQPRILLSADVVAALDTEQLSAVLAHESAHVRGRDGLRTLAIRFANALAPHAALTGQAERAYDLDREILCDDEAVERGADPIALADALVRVARLRAAPLGLPAAGGIHRTQRALRTRVELLLSRSDRPSSAESSRRPLVAFACAALAALALPHSAFGLIVSVHCGVESLVHFLA